MWRVIFRTRMACMLEFMTENLWSILAQCRLRKVSRTSKSSIVTRQAREPTARPWRQQEFYVSMIPSGEASDVSRQAHWLENPPMDEYDSGNHTHWKCPYHVVFIPKCRRRTLLTWVSSPCQPERRGLRLFACRTTRRTQASPQNALSTSNPCGTREVHFTRCSAGRSVTYRMIPTSRHQLSIILAARLSRYPCCGRHRVLPRL